MQQFLLCLLAAQPSAATNAEADALPESQRRTLGLGAALSHDRMEVIAWATAGEIMRLRFREARDARLRSGPEGRSEDVFVCFACDEVEFSAAAKDTRSADRAQKIRASLAEPAKGAVRNARGSGQLVGVALEAFPEDEVLKWKRDE